MQSLTTLSDPPTFPQGERDQTCSSDYSQSFHINNNVSAKTNPRWTVIGVFAPLVATLLVVFLIVASVSDRAGSVLANWAQSYVLNAGLTLQKIHIKGQRSLKDEQLVKALGIRSGQSLLGFDALEAQRKLAALGRVKSARVMRLLPSTLLVEVVERVPFARWLHDGQVDFIDKDGVVLGALSDGAQKSQYPLVVGKGAGKRAAALIRILSTHADLVGRIKMAERVAQYRWDLHAIGGAKIKLPPRDVALGLARFVLLPRWQAMLAQKNLVIDLRLPSRIFINEKGAQPSQSSTSSADKTLVRRS